MWLAWVLAVVTIFFTAALIAAAHERLDGGDPTVASALRAASARLGQILAWSLVTFLVLPIIVIEGLSFGAAIGRSNDLFKPTWGENVAARAGFGVLGLVLMLPAVLLVVLGAATG